MDIEGVLAISALFIGLPWLILHYMTQWRKAKGITIEDEQLLDDLHEMSRRLDGRLDSIERIIAADNPGWKDGALSVPVTRINPQMRERR
jgi:phage shock protein B